SCGQLVKYLEKENNISEQKKELEYWFNHQNKTISPQEVRVNIDHNIAKLSRNDARFFLINISPSEQEIIHLKERFGNKGTEEKLKEYANHIMDAYAQNFKRNGIENAKDLMWYGKLEQNRYYHRTDEEVKQGLVKVGETKAGEQMHIQIIVSRKDTTNKIKLSPMNTSRGKNQSHSAKLGQFDRVAFKESGEFIFDKMFEFNRSLEDSLHYKLIMKNGNAEQKRTIHLFNQFENKLNNSDRQTIFDTTKDIYRNSSIDFEKIVNNLEISTGLINLQFTNNLLENENIEEQSVQNKKKKRRRF
ncbi:MAG TPA: molybdopterin-guanine dinucleotide biosynthesis protein MobB, partial [Flavobacteriaceae bacterium]|nr:molybdopterin-guanine dinucleotide biosynthesis protein MobB [Flavobacteriaceae bacterium]